MKASLILIAAPLCSTALAAQPLPSAHGPEADLSSLNDEFDDETLDPKWNFFARQNGWPDRLKVVDVGRSVRGALHLQPYHGTWVRDLNATLLFQLVDGDFDVRARVRVRGAQSDMPGGTWSLGGLMARTPNDLTESNWEPRRENWHFITTGVGFERGRPMTETKGTFNSHSSLKLRPIRSGWVELRLVRIGMVFFALARPDGAKKWLLRDRFYRMQMNPQTQVGLIAYTTSDDVPAAPENAAVMNRIVRRDASVDMLMDVDWIRFSRPRPKMNWKWEDQVSAHPLADADLSDAAILKALGD